MGLYAEPDDAAARPSPPQRPQQTPAQVAADALPTATDAARAAGEGPVERAIWQVVGIATLLGVGCWLLMTVVTAFRYGWWLAIAGLGTWLAIRWLYFRLRGSETATCTVDANGVVHVLTGRLAIRRMARMYDVGASSWIRHGVVAGLAIGILGPILFVVLMGAFNAPEIGVVGLATFGFAAMDVVRHVVVILVWPAWQGQTRLDTAVMLPALAIYARYHGWRAAISGVPADQLAKTLAAHPEDGAEARYYTRAVAALSAAAQRLCGAG